MNISFEIATRVPQHKLTVAKILKLSLLAFLAITVAIVFHAHSSRAQQSTTFTLSNINTSGTGTSSGSAGSYTVNGAGSGVGGTDDSFSYLKIQTSGTGVELIAKVTSQQNTNSYATAGLMIRESLSSDSAHAMVAVSPLNGVNFSTRPKKLEPSDHPLTATTLGPSIAAPVWLKIVKSGNSVSGFSSSNGYSGWTLIGQTTLALSEPFYIGFAVASNSDPTLSTAQYSNAVFMRDVPQRSADLLLWLRADTGINESSGTITAWSDQSAFANNATQSVVANQPRILTNQINGFPSVDFTKLTTNRWLQVPSGFADLTNGVSIFAVVKPPGTATDARIVDFGNNTSSNNFQLYQPTTSGLSFRAYNGANGKLVTASTGMTSAYKLAEVVHNGDFKATLYINGSQVAQSTGPANMNNLVNIERMGNFIGKAFGTANYFEGQIAEILIFKKGVSDLERKTIESYFYYKYGLSSGSPPPPLPPTISVNVCNDDGCTLMPATGVYSTAQSVVMTADSLGTQIRYTTDGSSPSISSPLYSSAISVSSPTTFKAISVAGSSISDISVATVDIDSSSVDVSRLGLNLWLKGNVGVDTSGGGVSNWYDLSGNKLDAFQLNSGNRPTLTSGAVGGQPALTFNGTTQWLQLPKNFSNFQNGATFVVIAKATSPAASARFFDLSEQDSYNILMFVNNSTEFIYRVYNPTQTGERGTLDFTNFHFFEMIHSGSTVTLYTDGSNMAQNAAFNTIANVPRSTNFIGKAAGSASYLQGQIAEILVWDRPIDQQERAGVAAYIKAKYGLGIKPTLPSPQISPDNAVVTTSPQTISISASNNAEIRYTKDGSVPGPTSDLYSIPFTVNNSLSNTVTVRAIALRTNFDQSPEATSTIVFDPTSSEIANSNLITWLKADTLTGADESTVSLWEDFSGKNNSASQSNSANQPLLEKPAQNNLPAVKFNSANQQWMQFPAGFSDFTQGMTIFAVVKPTTSNAGRIIDFGNAASNDNVQFQQLNSTDFRMSVLNGASSTNVTGNGLITNTFQLWEARHNGADSVSLYLNGVLKATNSSMNNINNVSRSGNFLAKAFGSTSYFSGQIAELLIYDKLQSAGQCANVENYLIAKYALRNPVAPTISPATGVFSSPKEVVLATSDTGAVIKYSVTGGFTGNPNPTTTYTSPLSISASSTITATATINGVTSPLATAYIQIDNATKDLPRSGMTLWLKADRINPASPDLAVWPDMSGSENSATQSNGSLKPTYNASSGTPSGLPSINFSGSQWSQLPAGFQDFSQGCSIFVVAKPASSPAANARILDLGTGTSANNVILSLPTATQTQFWTSGNSVDSVTANSTLSSSEYKLLEVIHTGRGACQIASNGAQKLFSLLNNPTVVNRTANYIGRAAAGSGSPFFSGQIAELFLYNRTLDKDERRIVQAYLIGRYGLGSGLVVAPTIKPVSGVYSAPQEVSISAYPGGTIRYTTDGSNPDGSSPVYSSKFTVSESTIVKAIVGSSAVTTNAIKIDPTADGVSRSDLEIWYTADFGVQIGQPSVPSAPSFWKDLSGKQNDAAGNLDFPPTIDYDLNFPLLRSRPMVIAPGLSDFSQGLTFISVVLPDSSTETVSSILTATNFDGSSNRDRMEFRTAPTTQRAQLSLQRNAAVDELSTANNEFPSQRLHLLAMTQNATEAASIYVDGIEEAQSNNIRNLNNVTRLSNTLSGSGGLLGYQGRLAEVLLYKRALTPTELVGVQNYLTTKYQLLLPSSPSVPTISPAGGSFPAPIQVSLSAAPGASIFYTTDGSNPDPDATPPNTGRYYEKPISINFSQTVNAISIYQGVKSAPASQVFTLTPVIPTLWPAPNPSDTSPLDLRLLSPTPAIPQ